MMALSPWRWQISLATSRVIGVSASRAMKRSVSCTRGSESTLRNGDSSSLTATACKEAVLASLGAAVTRMRGKLGESLASLARMDTPIEQATTSSLEALKAFGLGDRARTLKGDIDAIPLYKRALELDPDVALAYARLGTVYSNIGESDLAVANQKEAYARRDRVSERERLYITAHYYNNVVKDTAQARSTYELWKQTYPNDPTPYVNLGVIDGAHGDSEAALASYLKAIEIDPHQRQAYANAAGRYLALHRDDEARALLLRQEQAMGLTPAAELLLARMAYRQHDAAEMARRLASVEQTSEAGSARAFRITVAALEGRFREVHRLSDEQVAHFERRGLNERAAITRSSQAVLAAVVGDLAAARAGAERALEYDAGPSPRINAAIAIAAAGDVARARRILAAAALPSDAVFVELVTPAVHAMLALQEGEPARAVDLLRATEGRELDNAIGTFIFEIRAQAYLALDRAADAEAQWLAIIGHPDLNEFALAHVVASLGVGRARALAGDAAGARQAYETFFEAWKDADADIPILVEARAEYARLALR